MGGFGSGRWRRPARKPRVDGTDCVDVNYCLARGLIARRQDRFGAVPLTWSECNYGGARPYFACPQCGRRCVKLYYVGDLLCRQCHGLAYQSQLDAPDARALHKAAKAVRRVAGRLALWQRLYCYHDAWRPPRPAGMWRRTYLRLMLQAQEERARGMTHVANDLHLTIERFGRCVSRSTRGRGRG